ncbi:MAG: NUDIX hydrolase [Pseudomonadota bacterium]
MRRFGQPPRKNITYRDRPGAYAILQKGNRLLLTEQADPGPELQLPGGGIDPGESPLIALHREVFEETGWSVRIIRKVGSYQRFVFMPEYDLWARKLCHIYLGVPGQRLGSPLEPGHRAVWLETGRAVHALAGAGDRWFTRRTLGSGT